MPTTPRPSAIGSSTSPIRSRPAAKPGLRSTARRRPRARISGSASWGDSHSRRRYRRRSAQRTGVGTPGIIGAGLARSDGEDRALAVGVVPAGVVPEGAEAIGDPRPRRRPAVREAGLAIEAQRDELL